MRATLLQLFFDLSLDNCGFKEGVFKNGLCTLKMLLKPVDYMLQTISRIFLFCNLSWCCFFYITECPTLVHHLMRELLTYKIAPLSSLQTNGKLFLKSKCKETNKSSSSTSTFTE